MLEKEDQKRTAMFQAEKLLKIVVDFELRVFMSCIYLAVFQEANEWTKIKWVTFFFVIGALYSVLETCFKEYHRIALNNKKARDSKIQ